MNAEDLLSSKILSNKDILIDLYSVVRQAAIDATTSPEVVAQSNNVCLLPLGEEGITRVTYTRRCTDSRDAKVIYLPDELTVIGGAALNLYEFELEDFRARRGIPELKDFTKKSTSDLDMVWWPKYSIKNPELQNMCAISQSIAIETLARTFTAKLQERFNEQKENNTKMMTGIKAILEDPETYVSTSVRPVFPAGVWTISCSFIANRTSYKIIDIAIHDTASSQKLDKYGYQITKLEPMINDPVYTTIQPNTPKTITQLDFEETRVSVCNISEFIYQQLFAFSLLLKEPGNRSLKALINYKRIIYIIELLNNIQSNNSRNINILRKVFNISSYQERTEFINKIISSINSATSTLTEHIIALCQAIEDRDNIINELYIIALTSKLSKLGAEYSSKLLNIESPLRKAKRSKKQLPLNIKRNIDKSVAELDAKYNNEINNIKREINILKPLSSKLLITKINSLYNESSTTTASTTASTTTTGPIISQLPMATSAATTATTTASRVPTPVINTVSNYIPMRPTAPPINNNYLRSVGYNIPYTKAYTPQNARFTTNNSTRKQSIRSGLPSITPQLISSPQYIPPKSQQNKRLLESYKKFSAPPLPPPSYYPPFPIENTYPVSVEQMLKSSRLSYDKHTNKYVVYDAYHNMEIPVIYDSRLDLYFTNDTINNRWIPLYYNTTIGKYYPVYYYIGLGNYGYYNDTIGKIVQLQYYPDSYSYKIIGEGIYPKDLPKVSKFKPLGASTSTSGSQYRRGGNKTRKNKNKN